MRRIILYSCCALFFGFQTSCKKGILNRICAEADKTNVAVGEEVTVTNCEDRTPPNIELDWGDGSERESSLDGTHAYSAAGTYYIKAYFRGDEADNDDLPIEIIVSE